MEHLYTRQVSFADTDAAGVVHFSRLLCYAEEAEHELLHKLGIPLMDGGGWPRVHVNCDYLAPVRMGDVVEVSISPVKMGHSSVQWSFTMTCAGATVAQGQIKTVRVDETGKPAGLEDGWRDALVDPV